MARVIDSVTNFGIVTVSTTYGASDTSIVLTAGHGARLPDTATSTAFNLTWWNSTDYSDPADDPNKEIVRCTARSTDTLTVTRGQEGTSGSTKNTADKVYKMVLSPTKKTIDDINTELERQIAKDVDGVNPTGFIDNENIAVAYSFTDRKITLTGNLTYYWKGVKHTADLSSPWTSTAHGTDVGTWFLSSTDGTTFTWDQNIWTFDQLMIAYVYYGGTAATSFCLREPHGIMDFKSHEEFHSQLGTYHVSGGAPDATTYTVNVASDAATTPGFDAAVIKDEDIKSTVTAWTQGTYTTMYIGPGSSSVFNIAASFPFVSAGSYLQVNNVTTGAMADGINNRYYNVYQILMPCAADVDSQKYRTLFLQPQATYTTLASAQAEDIRGLNLGNIPNLSTEFVIYTRITYITASGDGNTGKCRIATGGISYVIGNRAGVASVTGFTPTDHSILNNLDWVNTGHTGSATSVAGFSGIGAAAEYALDTDLASVSASDDTVPSAKATKAALDLKAPLISPSFTTPILGTPQSGNLTNCTFPTLNQDTTGKSAKTDALNSATTVVNVSSATAPTAGQVLKATSGTAATWQTATTTGQVMNETPGGAINGSNTSFTLAASPITGSLQLYLNGQRLYYTTDYTLSGLTITMVVAPMTGDTLLADYQINTGTFATGSTSFIYNETPSGLVNSSNTAYDTASNYVAGTIQVYRDGQLMKGGGADYTETDSNTITFVTAPVTGSVLLVTYQSAVSTAGNADTLDGQHAPTGTIVGTSDTQTLTNKTLTTPTINNPTLTFTDSAQSMNVRFSVYRNAAANTGNNAFAVIAHDTETFDTGNDVSSGVFTAPVAGYYHFSWQAAVTCDATARYVMASLFYDGSEIARGSEAKVTASTVFHSTGSAFIYMAAGKTADVRVYGEVTLALTVSTIAQNYFQGYLVTVF